MHAIKLAANLDSASPLIMKKKYTHRLRDFFLQSSSLDLLSSVS